MLQEGFKVQNYALFSAIPSRLNPLFLGVELLSSVLYLGFIKLVRSPLGIYAGLQTVVQVC